MRLLFVNHAHPASGLIGAVRLQRFAEELAGRGHRVVLLCAMRHDAIDTPGALAGRLERHDWSQPLVLAVRDDSPRPAAPSANRIGRQLQRARTASRLLIHGGPFWRWQRAARAFEPTLRDSFAPELAYATFGNLDALAIARGYARRHGIPWVMDIKDPASVFLPRMLAGTLMHRYRGVAAVTLNSEFQRSRNPDWADARSTVLYSGVETPPMVRGPCDGSRVALVGSVYDDEALATLLKGFAGWRRQRAPDAVLHYLGVDSARVAVVAGHIGATDGLIVDGQVPRDDLLRRCGHMAALMYASRPQFTFHHKLLELAATGRPLVTCPDAGAEARDLCARYGIGLTCATDAAGVSRALAAAPGTATSAMERLRGELAWPSVATQLEAIFQRALAAHPGTTP